jgi:hypothetical protein
MVNEIHESLRNRILAVQLAQLYLQRILYNKWRVFLKYGVYVKVLRWQFGLGVYQKHACSHLDKFFAASILDNVKYMQKKRSEVFFTL